MDSDFFSLLKTSTCYHHHILTVSVKVKSHYYCCSWSNLILVNKDLVNARKDGDVEHQYQLSVNLT